MGSFNAGRTLSAGTLMTLEAASGDIQPMAELTLLANTGLVLLDTLTIGTVGNMLVLDSDHDANGDGTLTVLQGKSVVSNNGVMVITAWDIDLQGTLNAGDAPLSVHAAKQDQSIGLGKLLVDHLTDLHITDEELMKITARGAISFERHGEGSIVVHSVSRKYSTRPDVIIFGDNYNTNPSYSHYIVSSQYEEARIQQVVMQAYVTPVDFEDAGGFDERTGRARIDAPRQVELGTDFVAQWVADVYSESRVSHQQDWVGLYRAGECDDESDLNHDSVIHECYVAYKYVDVLGEGHRTGEVRFKVQDYKNAGQYELRYFFGDSNGGQGYTCVTLGNVGATYKHCILRARATSSIVNIVTSGTSEAASGLPGL